MRRYTKPEMVMERIEMNQAIASCSKGQGSFTIEWKGYGHADTGGYSSTLFKTETNSPDNVAYSQAYQHYCIEDPNHRPADRIAGIYYVTNGTCKAYYEDFINSEGKYDSSIINGLNWGGPSGEDNWQWVEGASEAVIGTFVS